MTTALEASCGISISSPSISKVAIQRLPIGAFFHFSDNLIYMKGENDSSGRISCIKFDPNNKQLTYSLLLADALVQPLYVTITGRPMTKTEFIKIYEKKELKE